MFIWNDQEQFVSVPSTNSLLFLVAVLRYIFLFDSFFLLFFHRFVYLDLTHDIIFSHYFSSHVIRSLMICRTLVACNANVCINILWEIKTTDWMSRLDFKCFASKNLFIFYYFGLPYLSQILDICIPTETTKQTLVCLNVYKALLS